MTWTGVRRGNEDISSITATAQVNPFQFTKEIARLAEEGSIKIIIGSIQKFGYTADEVDVRRVQSVTYVDKAISECRSIPAATVVLAAGPWMPALFPSAPVSALKAYSVTIRPTRPILAYRLFIEISVPELESEEGDARNKRYLAMA